MINIEELLKPISAEQPCGEDLSYDPAMQELETLLRGKPETQFSQMEEPRWDEVRDRCVELLRRSKNLRVAMILCLALLRTEGVAGFRDGLAVIRGMVEQYWESHFPRLDPEDNNDPTERVNILTSLLIPLGSFEDPMQFLRRLREAKLSDSPQLGRFSLEEMSPSELPGGAGAQPPADAAQVQGSFRNTAPEKLEKVMTAVIESTASANAIDDFLTKTIGAGRAPDWAPLLGTLNDVRKAVAPFVAQPGESGAATGDEAATAPTGTSGAIQSRQDVIRTLDRLCDYYGRAEPSSPVPLLLRRAQRLAEMNFLEIISDLSPEALAPVQNVTGTKPAAPPAEAS
jgi:type VI secretion system protein ImpA